MARVTGGRRHSQRLQKAAQQSAQATARALYAAGQLIETHAERSITEGAVSGANHVPSAPGSPPNEDTGALRRSIETKIGGPNLVVVEAGGPSAPYAVFLEFGTAKMIERPFLSPAVEANRDEIVRIVGQAVRTTLR